MYKNSVKARVYAAGLREDAPVLGEHLAVAREAVTLVKEESFGYVEVTVVRPRSRKVCVPSVEQPLRRGKRPRGLVEEGQTLLMPPTRLP